MTNFLKPILILGSAAALCCCSGEAGNPAEALRSRLQDAAAEGKFLYFHQDDLVYGHSWKVEDIDADPLERSDVKAVCGQFPAGVGFDLGGIELGDEANLDAVPFALMRRAAVTQHGRGGAVTFSWHPRNPQTGGDAWDYSSDSVVGSILEGGENHDKFMLWLSRAADFIASLKDASGAPVPVIFRPWHEHLGGWFWWGSSCCSEEEYRALYILTHDYMVRERGLRNILWAYSPNSNLSEETFLSRYPGDEYVDIIGVDHYDFLSAEAKSRGEEGIAEANAYFSEVLKKDMAVLTRLATERGKLLAVCETGFESIPDPQWWTGTLLEALQGTPVCYVLTWRNACDKPQHFYAPFEGSADAEDFKAFCNDGRTIFLTDNK